MQNLKIGVKDSESLKKEILTQQEVSSYFSVSENTIIKWGKSGIIKPTRIGGRIYYRMKDIEALFTGMEGGVN